ncbi:hypothetical protein [Fluviicola sp.]|uniref:hypothetical protein n=1 Tax=Fluviicola sp. TaxID=1917219 RepID=UPI00262A9387|nr:hypothetical protein [Fluviicola sp.]
MKHLTLFYLLASMIISCTGKQIEPKSMNKTSLELNHRFKGEQSEVSPSEEHSEGFAQKAYNGISYTVDLMNAVDFVSRKGEKLSLPERLELSKESVAILKIDLQNMKETSVFESSKIMMDKEDALKYLVGQISTDFSIEQNGASVSATGVEYDPGISEPDNIKVFLFFNKINLNEPASVLYYDRLFGSGLMRFKINNGKKSRS